MFNSECAGASDTCQSDGSACASRCLAAPPAPGPGAACPDQICAAGLTCRTTVDGPQHCAMPLAEGAACDGSDSDPCARGLWCRPDQPDGEPGKCRAITAGGACADPSQCPGDYVCLVPDGAAQGVCGVGPKLGAPCHLYGFMTQDGPNGDCPITLSCYPDASGRLSCGAGRRLGEACGEVPVGGGNVVGVPCLEGLCSPSSDGRRVCKSLAQPGEPCGAYGVCAPGLGCYGSICAELYLPIGAACGGSPYMGTCGPDAYCALPADESGLRVCTATRPEGAACTLNEQCTFPATCVARVCRPC
jgi:hypothetical protein